MKASPRKAYRLAGIFCKPESAFKFNGDPGDLWKMSKYPNFHPTLVLMVVKHMPIS